MIKQTYIECNEHLRESDRKRDQLMAFYTVVVGAYFATIDKIPQINFREALTLTLVILGIILSLAIIQFRFWHIIYVNTATLLNLLESKKKSQYKNFYIKQTKIVKENFGVDKPILKLKWVKKYFDGNELLTFNAFLVVSFFPAYALLLFLGCGSSISSNNGLLFLIDLIIYFLIFNGIAIVCLYRRINKDPWVRWFLQGILGFNFAEEIKTASTKKR